MARRHTRSQYSRGQALVELAFVLPIFLLVLAGIIDFGRAVYAYNTVSNAAREATRLAIVDQTVTGIQAEAAKKSVGLGIAPSSVHVAFLNSDLSTTAPCDVAPVVTGCIAEVTVTYQYQAMTPILGAIVGPISINSTSRQAVERTYP